MSRRGLVAGLLVLGLLAAVPVGRWERTERAEEEIRGMGAVRAAVGPLDDTSLSAYRRLGRFDCLLYRRGREPFALELCIDRAGRVIEAIDRRSGEARIWSIREDAERSTLRVDRGEVDLLLRRMVT